MRSGVDNKPASVDGKSTSLGDKPPAQPIRVAARPRSKRKGPGTKQRRNKYVSPLFDDQGFPHPQDEWESMLPEVKAGRLIIKHRHDPPGLRDVLRPQLRGGYDEAKHGKVLCDELEIEHLTKFQREILTAVIKKYWRVFSKQGVTTPVKDYECEIDTGDAKPIRCKNPTFGPHETNYRESHRKASEIRAG